MMWLMVGIGGGLGAMARYALALNLAGLPGRFPFATFSANVFGSFLMGLLFMIIVEKGLLPENARGLLMVGFLGAFTTFSTFSLESLSLFQYHGWHMALFYVLLSVVASIVAAFLGYTLANTLS